MVGCAEALIGSWKPLSPAHAGLRLRQSVPWFNVFIMSSWQEDVNHDATRTEYLHGISKCFLRTSDGCQSWQKSLWCYLFYPTSQSLKSDDGIMVDQTINHLVCFNGFSNFGEIIICPSSRPSSLNIEPIARENVGNVCFCECLHFFMLQVNVSYGSVFCFMFWRGCDYGLVRIR